MSMARIKQYLLLAGPAVTGQLFTVIAMGLVTRQASFNSVSTLFSSLAIMALITDLLDFGTSLWSLREVASGRRSVQEMLDFGIKRGCYCLGIALIVGALLLFLDTPVAWLVVTLLPVSVSTNLLCLSLLRSENRYGIFAICQIADKLACLMTLLIYTAVGQGRIAEVYGLSVSLSPFVSILIAVAALHSRPRRVQKKRVSIAQMLIVYKSSRHFAITSIASDLSTLEIPAVALVAGPVAAANFGAAQRLSNPAGMPAGLIATRLQPDLSKRSWRPARDLAVRESVLLAPFFLVFAAVATWAPLVMSTFYGRDYVDEGAPALRMVLVAVALGSLNQILSTLFQAQGLDRQVARVVRFTIPLGLIVTTIMAYYYGALGAAVGLVAKEVCTSGALYRRVRVENRSLEGPGN